MRMKKVVFLLPIFFLLLVFFLLPAIEEGFQSCSHGCSSKGASNYVWKCLNKGDNKYYCCARSEFGLNNINTQCAISNNQE